MTNFCSLHNHSEYSNVRFFDSCIKIKDLVTHAVDLGFKGLALTDHECLSGAVKLLKIRDKVLEQHPDFKIIFGNEIYLIDETEIKNTKKYYHFILLARDEVGWQQLKDLSSRAWDRGYVERGMMRVPTTYQDIEEVVGSNPGHIIASTACLGGFLDVSIIEHDVKAANQFIKWGIKVFGKDYFNLEMQVANSEEQIVCNKVIIKLANAYGLKYLFTTDTHYLVKEDFPIHSAFLNSKQASDRETEQFYKYTYMMSIDEMVQILTDMGHSEEEIKTGFANTMLIYEQIENFDPRHSTIVPHAKIPEFTLEGVFSGLDISKYQYINKFINSEHVDDRYLIALINRGVVEKHIILTDRELSRIDTELSVVDKVSAGLKQTVSSYFLLMREVIDIAWNYSFVGAGRGSSTGFYINYLCDLVQVNPLQYGLPYWRFLNDVRFELPDIDTDINPAQKDAIMTALKEYYGHNNVLNCITFKTESLKAAIITAMRGLGYTAEEAQALSSMVPVDRGHVYTIDECINGNETLDLEPSPEVINKIKTYPGLFETVQKIEGVHTNASIHASAVYIFDHGYLEHNSLMRAPNGTPVTAFDMEDTNDLSGLKIDLLYTDAQNKMMKCMDLLLKDHLIEWQGSLRATYNRYLHPDVLNYKDQNMWQKASDGTIANLFQWETAVGAVAIKKAQPRSVLEMATINSAIRVQSEGAVQPIDRYIAFHKNINLWYQEMYNEGLDDCEIEIMREHLEQSSGCSLQQEDFMQLVMDPQIAGFTLAQSNKLRKTIAHKVLDQIAEQKNLFYSCCERQHTRQEFAEYVWKFCIEPLAKYSFSVIHAVVYSIVAVQEMNLATFYNPLYWQCACLCVNSGNSGTDFEDEDESVEEEDEDGKKKVAAPNYGKIARAISNAQHSGVFVALPDINTAQADFIPDVANNTIIYSLKAVTAVDDTLLEQILEKRPFSSLEDFVQKVNPTQSKMIGLIKAGCFDSLYPETRRENIMSEYLQLVALEKIPVKGNITQTQLKKFVSLNGTIPGFERQIRIFNFAKYVDKNQNDAANKRYLLDDPDVLTFFKDFYKGRLSLKDDQYYITADNAVAIKHTVFKKLTEKMIQPLMEYLNTDDGKKVYYDFLRRNLITELSQKYCEGNVSKWEMDTLSFYYHEHVLARTPEGNYNIKNFFDLDEKLNKDGEIVGIAGTVVNNDKGKHTVSLLTKYGVVDVKFYASTYNRFNQDIVQVDSETGKKQKIDVSWFKRGTNIIVYGQRRDISFVCKTWRVEGGYSRTVALIENIALDGSIRVRYNRYKVGGKYGN